MTLSSSDKATLPTTQGATMASRVGGTSNTSWTEAMTSQEAFIAEQRRLGEHWTVLGMESDIPADGDWFRTTLGGRSVFVQRFGASVRAFENVCPHRFYPLRTKDRGNGVIRCGFHHWQFNEEGVAAGIPKCKEMFGVGPREMGARLTPVEIATCGQLIFGRFAGDGPRESLEQSLGDAFPVVRAFCSQSATPRRSEVEVAANWRLLYHISLDDYHLVAVHPGTFGKGGYLPLDAPHYYRLGRHSAYFFGGDDDTLKAVADACRHGDYHPSSFRIFQLFPSALVVQVEAGLGWYVVVSSLVAVAPGRTLQRVWYFPLARGPEGEPWWRSLARRVAAPFVDLGFPYFLRQVNKEDNEVCEGLQSVAHQVHGSSILGQHETRIAWFEEAYAEAVNGAKSP